MAFFPLLGIHTGLAILIAFVFRLSTTSILVGASTSNPWTLAPMYMAGTLVGCFVFGVSPASLSATSTGPCTGARSTSARRGPPAPTLAVRGGEPAARRGGRRRSSFFVLRRAVQQRRR